MSPQKKIKVGGRFWGSHPLLFSLQLCTSQHMVSGLMGLTGNRRSNKGEKLHLFCILSGVCCGPSQWTPGFFLGT